MENLKEVLLAVKSGNDSAFEKLCDGYVGLLVSMSNKYYELCKSKGAEKEEFLQETKYAFYKASCSFDFENGKVTFGNYAKTCIRYRLISLVRKYNSKKRSAPIVASYDEKKDGRNSGSNCDELGDPMTALAEKNLSSFENKVFSMYLAGMKGKEISQRLGKEEKSINNAIYRVKVKLKGMSK